MIGIFYIGDKRHNLDLAKTNHQPLIDQLSGIANVNVYDFTKGFPGRGVCPFDDGGEDTELQRGASGAVQVWDFATSVDRITDDIVIKMRTDVWLTESSVKVIIDHVKQIIAGQQDIVFFGCDVVNDNQGIEHQATPVTQSDPARIQDFIIAAKRSALPPTTTVVNRLLSTVFGKRVSGNQTFRALVNPDTQACTVLCHIWLIRKPYHWRPTDSEVYNDFVQTYIKRSNKELFDPAVNWWRQYYRPTIGAFYIGQQRFADIGKPNHQALFDALRQLLPLNIYDFSKLPNTVTECPFKESGGVQVWDFIEATNKIQDQYIIKLRTDLWFTPSSINCIVDGMQRIIQGTVDAEFYGSNWAEFLGHENSRFPIQDRPWVQDFVVSARRSVLRTPQQVLKDLYNCKPSTRLCGTKVYRSITNSDVTANNVMCQIYLIRKHYDQVDPWQVGLDYILSYEKQHKMPNAVPWYLSTKPNEN